MADNNTDKAPASAKEPTLRESIAEKIKSRSSMPVILDGRANRFDLRRYGNHDYTAGGQLQPRFVVKSDERIQQCIAEGYDFPKQWDSRLPNLEVSGLVLMLRSNDHAHEVRNFHLETAEQLDRSKAPSEHAKTIAREARENAEFIHHGPEKPVNVTVGADAKSLAMGGAPRVMGPE